jgi:hypothetical protein
MIYKSCITTAIGARQKSALLLFLTTNGLNGVAAYQRGVGVAFG